LPKHTDRPGRRLLWTAALRLLGAHPLLGVGPDNYRLLYGAAAGLQDADTRVHSNNMYLEVLVGSGVLGALAFAWLIWRLGVATASAARRPALGPWPPLLYGVGAAVVAIALHGFVDCFVGFTPTYVTIAVTLGLVLAGAQRADARMHAHRV
jgi:O-antigen ligase